MPCPEHKGWPEECRETSCDYRKTATSVCFNGRCDDCRGRVNLGWSQKAPCSCPCHSECTCSPKALIGWFGEPRCPRHRE